MCGSGCHPLVLVKESRHNPVQPSARRPFTRYVALSSALRSLPSLDAPPTAPPLATSNGTLVCAECDVWLGAEGMGRAGLGWLGGGQPFSPKDVDKMITQELGTPRHWFLLSSAMKWVVFQADQPLFMSFIFLS